MTCLLSSSRSMILPPYKSTDLLGDKKGVNHVEAEQMDAYFSADVETDGPIPGPYSMLSFALVFAGTYDGETYERPKSFDESFYRELKPISDSFQPEALSINNVAVLRIPRHTSS